MALAEVTEQDTEDRTEWRWKIRCGDPLTLEAERRRRLADKAVTTDSHPVYPERDVSEGISLAVLHQLPIHRPELIKLG